jgi:hypothetical protein
MPARRTQAELLGEPICDDEIIQAIGRGRGVNCTADDPLEVQVLADVALPMVHDRVVAWDSILPDLFQRMLLAGIATDSPADAAVLRPETFKSAEQAKKAFQRGVFGGHSPIDNTRRGMSLKSVRYRRAGRGHAWQTACWLDGDASAVRTALAKVMGPIDGWS